MSYFMSFQFYGTILYWVSCIQFMHMYFIYTMYSYIFVFWGGYVLLVFVTHYIIFRASYGVPIGITPLFYAYYQYIYVFFCFCFFWYFACITQVYLSFLCLSKLDVFIFSLSLKFFWVNFFCIVLV